MLNEMAKEIHENAVAHGWWEEERKIPEILMLCVSELSEALEEYRDGKPMEYTCCTGCQFNPHDKAECGEECSYARKQKKPEGIAVEMVDCIIRCLDYLAQEGVDIDGVMDRKMEYNEGRPYKHGGKVC